MVLHTGNIGSNATVGGLVITYGGAVVFAILAVLNAYLTVKKGRHARSTILGVGAGACFFLGMGWAGDWLQAEPSTVGAIIVRPSIYFFSIPAWTLLAYAWAKFTTCGMRSSMIVAGAVFCAAVLRFISLYAIQESLFWAIWVHLGVFFGGACVFGLSQAYRQDLSVWIADAMFVLIPFCGYGVIFVLSYNFKNIINYREGKVAELCFESALFVLNIAWMGWMALGANEVKSTWWNKNRSSRAVSDVPLHTFQNQSGHAATNPMGVTPASSMASIEAGLPSATAPLLDNAPKQVKSPESHPWRVKFN